MNRFFALLFFIPFFAQAQFKITVSRTKDPVYFRGTLFDEKNFLAKDTVRGTLLTSKTPLLRPEKRSVFELPKTRKIFLRHRLPFCGRNIPRSQIQIRGKSRLFPVQNCCLSRFPQESARYASAIFNASALFQIFKFTRRIHSKPHRLRGSF